MRQTANSEVGADRTPLLLFAIAVLVYAPGLLWGLPEATSIERMLPWGSDELAPTGPLAQLVHVVFGGTAAFDPRYPLLPYAIQSAFIAPFLAFRWLTGDLAGMSTTFPYGLVNPVRDLAAMTVAARLSSLVAASALPVVAFLTVRRLADRYTARIAGVFVLLLYPLFYYSRTSNVDAAALLLLALGLLAFAGVLRDGLTKRHAMALGTFAALAVATKDQNYAVFVAIGIASVLLHWRTAAGPGGRRAWRGPAIALATSVAVYVVASGLIFSPVAFIRHVEFIVLHPSGGGSGQSYFSTPATLAGIAQLTVQYVGHIVDSLGLPMALAGLAGLVVVGKRSSRLLLLALPVLAIFAGVLLPVRFARIRFVLPAAYVVALFAAFAVAALHARLRVETGRAQRRAVRRLMPVLLIAIIAGWGALRGADLTWQMFNDSRLVLADWIQSNARPGDRIGYYGAALKLPHLPADVRIEQGPHAEVYERPDPDSWPEFIVIIPQQPFETDHEWNLPADRYRELVRGDWDYDAFIAYRGPSLFDRRPINWVNPPIRLFVRRDIVDRLDRPVRRLELD